MRVTMIGHSTVWIEAAGVKIITDPYFGLRGNPAYARVAPPFKTREEWRGADLVLVTHNHWDHTDPGFFRMLARNLPVVAPRRSAWLTRLKGAGNLVGLRKWEQKQFGAIRITAVPALHAAVTHGYVMEAEDQTLYFAGDTYFRPFMKDIGSKFSLNVALMPVTTFRIPLTLGEKGAVQAVAALLPKTVIPIHLGIRPRSPLLRTNQTPEGFSKRLRDAGLKAEVCTLREGQCWES